jgi:sugar phosphate isomerase/epimerase
MVAGHRIAYLTDRGFADSNPEEVVSCLSQLGYDGVEWGTGHFNVRTKSDTYLHKLVQLSAEAGLGISEVIIHEDFVSLNESVRRERIQFVLDSIEAAYSCGIKIMNLFTGPAPWDPTAPKLGRDIPEGTAFEQVVEAFTQFVEIATKRGICIALEAVFGHVCREYFTTMELLRRITSPNLGVNMDPSHYVLYGNDLVWAVKQLARKIVHVHLKDVIGRPGVMDEDFMFPLLGEGRIDWSAFLQALESIHYDGYLSVEFESFRYYHTVLADRPEWAAQLSMEHVKAIFGENHQTMLEKGVPPLSG